VPLRDRIVDQFSQSHAESQSDARTVLPDHSHDVMLVFNPPKRRRTDFMPLPEHDLQQPARAALKPRPLAASIPFRV
jgi:hypothetical protein